MAPEKLGKGAPEKVIVERAYGDDDIYGAAVGAATGNVLYVSNLRFKHCVLQKLYECEAHGILSAQEIIQYYFVSPEVSDEELAQCIAMEAGADLNLVQTQCGPSSFQVFSKSRAEIIRSYVRNRGDIIECIMELMYALNSPLFSLPFTFSYYSLIAYLSPVLFSLCFSDFDVGCNAS